MYHKAKVTGENCSKICCWMITPVRIHNCLNLVITCHSRKIPNGFEFKRSEVNLAFNKDSLQICFYMIIPVCITQISLNFTYMYPSSLKADSCEFWVRK